MIEAKNYEWTDLDHSQKMEYILNNSKPELSEEINYAKYIYGRVKNNGKSKYVLMIGGIALGALTSGISTILSTIGIVSSMVGACKYTSESIENDDLEYTLEDIKNKL